MTPPNCSIRAHIIERVIARRGKLHWFDHLDPRATALVVIDMQETFCAPGAPAEVAASRDIVPAINDVARRLRALGGQVIYVLHANAHVGARSDWSLFFDHVVADEVRARTIESLSPGRQKVWRDLAQDERDLVVLKNRYSALISGSSNLERVLRSMNIDTLLIAGRRRMCAASRRARCDDARLQDHHAVGLLRGAVAR